MQTIALLYGSANESSKMKIKLNKNKKFTHIVFYFGSKYFILFTDMYPKRAGQNFQNKL